MKTEPDKSKPAVPATVPQEPSGDAFPAEKDVSAAPEGSDESDHEDKKG